MLGLRHYHGTAIDLWQGDITTFACDAIVNASNPELTPGGGVSGAIHAAGGERVTQECAHIGGILTGEAVATSGGNLPANYVIHTSGPIWQGGAHQEKPLLMRAYTESLKLAESLKCRHITFPALSAGIYGYPLEDAAFCALDAVKQAIDENAFRFVKRISFALYDRHTYLVFQSALFSVFAEELYEHT